tara:strand:+ start:2257 stop:4974 length:2718 start_codon:yes stop_codon:yes gene_type:complete
MKNKFLYFRYMLILFCALILSNAGAREIFKFEVTEIEITQNGNIFKGYNGGKAFTNDGISIKAENFEYNKILTLLISDGNVEMKDTNKNIIIKADKILYFKNKEIIVAETDVEVRDVKRNIIIKADKISFFKKLDKIVANKKVELKDLELNSILRGDEISYFRKEEKIIARRKVELIDNKEDIIINTDKITYLKEKDEIFTEGQTVANIQSKYKFSTSDVKLSKIKMELSSPNKSVITDNTLSLYEAENFNFQIEDELLKASNILIVENKKAKKGESDRLFFESGFFNFKNKEFKTGYSKIELKNNTFNRSENDPRIYGSSASKKNNITTLNKAVFTSCKKTDKCPPWQLEAFKIEHNKDKKQLIYDDAILKVYNVPVFYFPKFFHPDPTVKRQSGFLSPRFNNSNILGSSLSIPYYFAISEDKDLTINPIFFSKSTKMLQNEFRQKKEDSYLIADFGVTNNFKSLTGEKKNINHLFAKIEKNLKLNNFIKSDLNIFLERITNDKYLKIFGDNFPSNSIKPEDPDSLKSGFDFFLEHDNFLLSGGANVFENLTLEKSDRYQFVLPYYNFSKNLYLLENTSINLSSKGNNTLDNTNNVKSRIINDMSFKINEKIFENFGLKNNLNFYFKNLNSLGKNVEEYKSSPQIELQSLVEFNSELPLIKFTEIQNESLIPRMSLRLNPGEMKNHSSIERKINMDNIFNINRIGVDDSFEAGHSLTIGIDYKKENKKNRNNYLEFNLASVFRDTAENNIPKQTTLNNKNSNLFGSIEYSMSENMNIDYNFSVDNKIENFDYNSIGLDLSLNNFVTTFNFIEENSIIGSTNIFENETKYNLNESNMLSFKTRRNREVNLTEYYDLVYEYKNDCLTAGVKFNKTYYEDSDLKPTENLMFTISFFPLTTIDQKINN